MRTGLLNGDADLGLLMDREVVEDDHIATSERRDEHLLDIGAERDAIDGAVEDGRRGHLRRAEGRHERVRLPMAARGVIRDARAARAARIAAQEIRRDPGFVDEHIVGGIVQRQRLGPASPRCRHVSAALFAGVYGFF